VVVHEVEATSPLLPDSTNLCISETSTAGPEALWDRVEVNECTVFSHDEELFSESTIEQKTSFEQTQEMVPDQHDEQEIWAEETVDQKSGFEAEDEIMAEVSCKLITGWINYGTV